jgi:hypothetical protein
MQQCFSRYTENYDSSLNFPNPLKMQYRNKSTFLKHGGLECLCILTGETCDICYEPYTECRSGLANTDEKPGRLWRSLRLHASVYSAHRFYPSRLARGLERFQRRFKLKERRFDGSSTPGSSHVVMISHSKLPVLPSYEDDAKTIEVKMKLRPCSCENPKPAPPRSKSSMHL